MIKAPEKEKKYLLLTPRSDGVRLVKPGGLVGRDLVVGPRAPGAGGCRVLDPSRGVVIRGAGHLDGRLVVIWSQARRQLAEARAAKGLTPNRLQQTPRQPRLGVTSR